METFIVLFVITIIIAFVLYFLLKQALAVNEQLTTATEVLTEENNELLKSNTGYDVWFEELKSRVIYSYQRIKSIDASGHFEADDEVGYFFTELKAIIERLYELGIIDETEKEEALDTSTPRITTEELAKVLSQRNAATAATKKEG